MECLRWPGASYREVQPTFILPCEPFAGDLAPTIHLSIPMASIPVFADASSRLQADIALVRLIRAGIPADRISAVFPRRRAPNAVCCWLKHFQDVPFTSAIEVAAAGVLGRLFKSYSHIRSPKFGRELEVLNLTPGDAKRVLEKVEEDRIVLCVHARNEVQASIAWHVFQHVGAENISSPAGAEWLAATKQAPTLPAQVAGLVAA